MTLSKPCTGHCPCGFFIGCMDAWMSAALLGFLHLFCDAAFLVHTLYILEFLFFFQILIPYIRSF